MSTCVEKANEAEPGLYASVWSSIEEEPPQGQRSSSDSKLAGQLLVAAMRRQGMRAGDVPLNEAKRLLVSTSRWLRRQAAAS